jgi:hypothetical protein
LRVAFNNNASLRLSRDQAAQGEPPQCAQERLHQATQANATAQLSEAESRLQQERNTRAENVPAHNPVSCTSPDCEAEVAMQQFVFEERLMVEAQQEFGNAFRKPPANCPRCKAALSPNDRNALNRTPAMMPLAALYFRVYHSGGGISPSKKGPITPS